MESQEKICRICLCPGNYLDFTQIFANQNEIALKLYLISGISTVELIECNIPALICEICLKELHQCFEFRKKCRNAAEFFKNQTHRTESELWKIEEIVAENVETNYVKMEPCKEESIDEDIIRTNLDFLRDDDDSQLGEYFNEFVVEKVEGIRQETADFGKQKKTKKKISTNSTGLAKKRFSCKYCGVTLSRKDRMIRHESLHVVNRNQDIHECFFCGKTFDQKLCLIPHFKKIHNFKLGASENWKCAICVDTVLSPPSLAIHYENAHSNFSFTPAKTQKPELKPYLHEKAIKTKLKEKNVSNKPIEKTPRPRKRRDRRKPKVPKNFFPCSICGGSFTNLNRYQKHLLQMHQVSKEQAIQEADAMKPLVVVAEETSKVRKIDLGPEFPCSTCGKIFASSVSVRAHEKIHLNLQFKCDLCAASFRVKAYLTTHMIRVHIKLKKFKCSFENCTMAFAHQERLNYHLRKHLNIRNYVCKYCGKTFVTSSCCKIHERIHTDERPYSCKYCDRAFIHHSDYRRHELKHVNNQL